MADLNWLLDGITFKALERSEAGTYRFAVEIEGSMPDTAGGALAAIASALDISLSDLRNALTGAGGSTLDDLVTLLAGGLPASLGQKAKAASMGVTLASDEDLLGRLGEVQASPTANTLLARLKDLLTGIVLAAGTNLIGKTQPFAAATEIGVTELIGINEQVDQNKYSASVSVALGGTYSGEILGFALVSTEDGSGVVQKPEGWLYILDVDPETASNDAALAAAEWPTVLGRVKVEASDWQSDANGGLAYIVDTPVAFHALSTLYFVFQVTSAAGLNDAAGDDEQLELNAWYRRDS